MRIALSLLLLIGALCAAAEPAASSAPEAADAYHRGDFAAVLRACSAEAQAGDASCQSWLGVLYAEGKGVTRDAATAAGWFRRAAEQGHGAAAYNLARAYEEGDGVAKDLRQAQKWSQKAAEQGIPYAQLQLGMLLMRADRNMNEAVKWFKLAAAQGLPIAQGFVGSAYELGDGVRRNYRSAVKWYEVAAEHGDTLASGRLASLYEHGLGIDADAEEAYFWYRVALKDPHDPSRQEDEEGLRRVAAQLSKKQLAAAEQAVREWHPEEAVIGPPKRARGKAPRPTGEPQLFATGTGFFVSRNGHLLTNNHVVAECATCGSATLTRARQPKSLPPIPSAISRCCSSRMRHPPPCSAVRRSCAPAKAWSWWASRCPGSSPPIRSSRPASSARSPDRAMIGICCRSLHPSNPATAVARCSIAAAMSSVWWSRR
jgi:hypothetical protein